MRKIILFAICAIAILSNYNVYSIDDNSNNEKSENNEATNVDEVMMVADAELSNDESHNVPGEVKNAGTVDEAAAAAQLQKSSDADYDDDEYNDEGGSPVEEVVNEPRGQIDVQSVVVAAAAAAAPNASAGDVATRMGKYSAWDDGYYLSPLDLNENNYDWNGK